jgi:hypothetical protein
MIPEVDIRCNSTTKRIFYNQPEQELGCVTHQTTRIYKMHGPKREQKQP